MNKKGLGRGLEALFEDNSTEQSKDNSDNIINLRISQIEPDRNQPRKSFDQEKLEELALSLRQHGIIQPIIVRPIGNERYCIVAGERRWRAARIAEFKELPCVVREYNEQQISEIALIENLQREDLNPVEEAFGYKTIMEKFSLTQDRVSEIVGKSRPVIANALRLLALPEAVLELLKNGLLTAGHARALLSLGEENLMIETALQAAKGELTVRDIEQMPSKKQKKTKNSKGTHLFIVELEEKLKETLGRRVKISCKGNEKALKGKVELEFYSNDDLEKLLALLDKGV